MLGDYDTPRGRPEFLETMAGFFNRAFGWEPGCRETSRWTTGSQAANFLLFNMLAGSDAGSSKKILFPIVPEYIGYASQGIREGMFTAWETAHGIPGQPPVQIPHQFRDEIGDDIAAICLSRPTNPTANVITDDEMQRPCRDGRGTGDLPDRRQCLRAAFPNVCSSRLPLSGARGIIHTFSLSKLGLPATRTGIVVANKEIIRRLSIMNASMVLSTGAIGQTSPGASLPATRSCKRAGR